MTRIYTYHVTGFTEAYYFNIATPTIGMKLSIKSQESISEASATLANNA